MGTLANAFDLLSTEEDHEASTIVALKTVEAKKFAEEQKKIAAEKKKAEAAKKKKAEAKKKKKKEESSGQKSLNGNAVDQRYNGHQHYRRSYESTMFLTKEESYMQWLERRAQWLAREEEKKKKEEEWKKNNALMTLKEYEEKKASEKKQKAEKSTTLSVVPETPFKEATHENVYTKPKFKNGPSRGMGKDSGNSKHNQENAVPNEAITVKVVVAVPPPDLSEANFPVLGKYTKPTKASR